MDREGVGEKKAKLLLTACRILSKIKKTKQIKKTDFNWMLFF